MPDYPDMPRSADANLQVGNVHTEVGINVFANQAGENAIPGIDIQIKQDDGQSIGIWVNDSLVHTYTPEVQNDQS